MDGETGRIGPPRDGPALAAAIDEIVGDPALRSHFGAAAVERSRDFEADRLLDRYIEMYEAAEE